MNFVRSFSRTLSHAAVVWLSVAVLYVYMYYYHDDKSSPHGTTRFSYMKSSSTEMHVALAVGSILASAAAAILYAVDKLSAKFLGKPQYRVSEYTLHMTALLGGWPGAALSQQVFRHKCRKETFLQGFVACVSGYFVLVACFVYLFG